MAVSMNVCCVIAHPDDETLGAGATLARHAANGDDVHVLLLSDGVTSRYDERTDAAEREIEQRRDRAREACDHLGADSVSFHEFPDNQFDTVALLDIVQTVEAEFERQDPDVVYTHHHGDLNVDHELTARAVLTAGRPLPDAEIDRIFAFETLSSTEWAVPKASNAFHPTVFVEVSEYVDKKIDALRTYESELREHPHPRSVENIRRNLCRWGATAGLPAAEPFELLREVNR